MAANMEVIATTLSGGATGRRYVFRDALNQCLRRGAAEWIKLLQSERRSQEPRYSVRMMSSLLPRAVL
ncbi:hypothetical protein J5N97_019307 [Dioscorea zingiberensis]|uniref:Uncharacterized protein n=1 Tax=Dioscorea zingiberensis TaxID=325984 RepID=A0A9D5CEP6_9LILI|nr:hypothetical protein J5N97_019307 [Dioscorea zingiberensis]